MARRMDMAGRWKGRLLFIATLWSALTVAMLSALLPNGLPMSRPVGSAFDPATSVVVLKARSPAASVTAREAKPDDGMFVPLNSMAVLVPVSFIFPGIWLLCWLPRRARRSRFALSACPLDRPRARAPPAVGFIA